MKLRTRKSKWLIRFRAQWVWKRLPEHNLTFAGPLVIERRRR